MRTFSHLPYQQRSPPALLDRLEISEEQTHAQQDYVEPALLRRLEMNDVYPSLLERMERGNSPRDLQPQAMKGVVIQEVSMEMDRPWHKNPSISWTTSSRNSGAKTSRNSRRYPTSSLSSTLIHQDQSERKTLRSNITRRRSTKSTPLLLQRFSEVNMPNEDYSAPEILVLFLPRHPNCVRKCLCKVRTLKPRCVNFEERPQNSQRV